MPVSNEVIPSVVLDVLVQDRGCDSAIGCLLGLALGDAVGAPLEFCAVDASPQVRERCQAVFTQFEST